MRHALRSANLPEIAGHEGMQGALSHPPTRRDDSPDWPFEPFPDSALAGSVLDRFDEIARRHAGRLAASDDARSLTYREVAALADAIAAAIAVAVGSVPGPVGIFLRNEARYVAAMLGAFASGRGYVPIDPDQPGERSQVIAREAGVVALVSAGAFAATARSLFPAGPAVVDIEEVTASARPAVEKPGPDDLAWITHTSGSTGVPKGVYQNHRGLLCDIMRSTNALRLSADDRMAVFSSPTLYHGTRIAFGALLNGASLHTLSPIALRPEGLARELRRRGITIFRAVPTLFRRVAETLRAGERLESLRLVFLGGDRVGWHDFDVFRNACRPDAAFAVHIGSTEAPVLVQWFVDESVRRPGAALPVGREPPGQRVALLDDAGNAVPDGTVGEFTITSQDIALGYWRNPELTARAFQTDPADPQARAFRTGDLGRRRADGLYEYVGRKDHQIKLHGFRIEPGEIENILRGVAGVLDAAIVVRRSEEGAPRSLVAYCERDPDARGLMPRHLLQMLSQSLPRHMMPAAIALIEELPRLASLKIDRARLAEIDAANAARPAAGGDIPLLQEVSGVFERVLMCGGATADDNVATLGGDSLQALNIAAELETLFGVAVPPHIFEKCQNIRELAVWIGAEAVSPSHG